MAHLNNLSLAELAPVWQKKQQLEQWKRQQLLNSPWIIPDKVKRIKAIAAATIGTPWWLSDLAYAQKRLQSASNAKPENARTQKLYR